MDGLSNKYLIYSFSEISCLHFENVTSNVSVEFSYRNERSIYFCTCNIKHQRQDTLIDCDVSHRLITICSVFYNVNIIIQKLKQKFFILIQLKQQMKQTPNNTNWHISYYTELRCFVLYKHVICNYSTKYRLRNTYYQNAKF